MPEIMAMAWLNVTRAGCDCLSVGAVAMMTALDTSDVKKRAPPVASCPAQTASPTTAPHDPHAIRIRTVPIRHSPSGPPLDFKRSEEQTSELQSLMRNSYDVFCLKKKKNKQQNNEQKTQHCYIHKHKNE